MQYTGYLRYLIICSMVNRVDLFYSVLSALIHVFPVFLPGAFLRVYDTRGGGGCVEMGMIMIRFERFRLIFCVVCL